MLMLTKNHKGMWLKKNSDLVFDVKTKIAKMKMAYGKNTLFYVYKYDIKEFFTNVVIAHVMPVLEFYCIKMKRS